MTYWKLILLQWTVAYFWIPEINPEKVSDTNWNSQQLHTIDRREFYPNWIICNLISMRDSTGLDLTLTSGVTGSEVTGWSKTIKLYHFVRVFMPDTIFSLLQGRGSGLLRSETGGRTNPSYNCSHVSERVQYIFAVGSCFYYPIFMFICFLELDRFIVIATMTDVHEGSLLTLLLRKRGQEMLS